MSDSVPQVARWAIAGTVFLTCVLFAPALADPVNVVKLTALMLAAVLVLGLSAASLVRERTVTLAPLPVAVTVALLVAFVAAAVAAPTGATAVVGTYGRNSGLLAYAAAIVLFLVGLRVWTPRSSHLLGLSLVAGGLFTAGYGLLQYAGIDPIAWSNPFNPIIGALGNPDFASGYLGCCVPPAVWGALSDRAARPWRLLSALIAVLCLLTAGLSSAVQGPLAAAAGLTVVAIAWLLNRGGTVARRGLTALAGLATLGVAVLLAGAAHVGPAKSFFTGISWSARTWYWGGALSMFRDHPVLGVGLDHYGARWRQVRPAASTQQQGGDAYSDAAHSVPLQMLAQGGTVLAIAYLAFSVLVAISLIRGLRRLQGEDRLLLGGLGGAWAAYVVQSVVSIDQVPLLTVQFATGGAVVAMAAYPTRLIRLPGARPPEVAKTGRRGRQVPAAPRRLGPVDLAALSVIGLVGLVMAWYAFLPLRANAAVRSGDVALRQGKGNAALVSYQDATGLLPGIGVYWERTGQLFESVKRPADALSTYEVGARHDPFDVALLRNLARLAQEQGDKDQARDAALRAVDLDPTNPATVTEAAQILRSAGDPARALTLVDHILSVLPGNADLWAARGACLAAQHDAALAKTAFEKALALDPNQAAAKAGLDALDASAHN